MSTYDLLLFFFFFLLLKYICTSTHGHKRNYLYINRVSKITGKKKRTNIKINNTVTLIKKKQTLSYLRSINRLTVNHLQVRGTYESICKEMRIKQEKASESCLDSSGSSSSNGNNSNNHHTCVDTKKLILEDQTYIIHNYENKWKVLQTSAHELQLKYCFCVGQEFSFIEVNVNTYIGVINNKIYLFKETNDHVFYQCLYAGDKSKVGVVGLNNMNNVNTKSDDEDIHNFFNLDFPLTKYINMWKKKNQRMNEITKKITGLRILKTDPVEAFFGFLCSSNNNIPRITLMIECLKRRYGKFMASVFFQNGNIIISSKAVNQYEHNRDNIKNRKLIKNEEGIKISDDSKLCGDSKNIGDVKKESVGIVKVKKEIVEDLNCFKQNDIKLKLEQVKRNKYNDLCKKESKTIDSRCSDNKIFYENVKNNIKKEKQMKEFVFFEFPSVFILSKLTEDDLKDLGFGYRSRYIIESSKMLLQFGVEKWFLNLQKEKKTKKCIDMLLQFPGVGLKVANCICLFGLNKYDCLPIDTHIFDIIQKYYHNIIDNITSTTPYTNKKRNQVLGQIMSKSAKTRINLSKKHGNATETNDKTTETNGKATQSNLDNMKNSAKTRNKLIKKKNINNTHSFKKALKQNVVPDTTSPDSNKKIALTNTLYLKIFENFKKIFGPNCGWAQTILFTSELKKFSHIFS
uniref:DNA-(apurinic or apyrimidinic site) lyase n=1 Tax=Piliocolobus tephrosceles TaxID=591936 RepID=A0A8C9GK86_9PRIM